MTNVLVVDDSDVDRLLMEGLLGQAAEFTVIAAENGEQALRKLEEWDVDIIVTDLQMPRMNGLELVKKVRESALQIPVVLTTGVGSEEIAASALRAGASGYIPKSKLNEMLVPTLLEILEILNGETSYNRLLDCTKVSRYEFELDNDPELISMLVDFCERTLVSSSPLDRIDCLRIAVAVDQALQNAIYRGNLEIDNDQSIQSLGITELDDAPMYIQERFKTEPYKSRKTKVVTEIKRNRFAVLIEDEGPGFDTSTIGDMKNLSTRGTNLISAFMDTVEYNDKGNRIMMSFKFDRSKVRKKESAEEKRKSARIAGRLVCEKSGQVYDITQRKYVIGRRNECHLKLQGDKIALLHCMLVNEDNEVMLLNLSADHKTLVNGRAGNGVQLSQGDLISVGDHSFLFEAAKK